MFYVIFFHCATCCCFSTPPLPTCTEPPHSRRGQPVLCIASPQLPVLVVAPALDVSAGQEGAGVKDSHCDCDSFWGNKPWHWVREREIVRRCKGNSERRQEPKERKKGAQLKIHWKGSGAVCVLDGASRIEALMIFSSSVADSDCMHFCWINRETHLSHLWKCSSVDA